MNKVENMHKYASRCIVRLARLNRNTLGDKLRLRFILVVDSLANYYFNILVLFYHRFSHPLIMYPIGLSE